MIPEIDKIKTLVPKNQIIEFDLGRVLFVKTRIVDKIVSCIKNNIPGYIIVHTLRGGYIGTFVEKINEEYWGVKYFTEEFDEGAHEHYDIFFNIITCQQIRNKENKSIAEVLS